jgi:general secretion pathway protein K
MPTPGPGPRRRVEKSLDTAGTSARATSDRGSALLAVLWLSAALAAIAFSLSTTVRGEIERTATAIDGLRSYYIASGAIDRAAIEVLWSVKYPNERPLPQGVTQVDYDFPDGVAHVEIMPEAGKLNVNQALPEDLYRLGVALGLDPQRAREIAMAIDDWRRPSQDDSFDRHYLALTPSFHAPHASFQEIEELLAVRGVTPDIFYGTWLPGSQLEGGRRLIPRPGLMDCLSVFGAQDRVDANTAQPAVLAAVGLSPYAVNALVERRRKAPLTMPQLSEFLGSIDAGGARLRVEGNSIVTFRATARLRAAGGKLSDLRRTVEAMVKYMPAGYDSAIHILRWYDTAWSN